MRLHSLRLRAFGPFAAEQRIDFEPLGAGGLFLLDGPTGAGKSTVLDAITFALYGPGEGGGWGRLHSHFAGPGVEPEVALEFSLRGVRQRVTRSPEYPRPKRRGEGFTVEKAQVHLERWERDRWVSRSARKDEVGEVLADDLGLSRDQFTQVVLLPQGEFMRFLRAGDDERRGLLTKLFGTQLYDRITDELDRRRQVASRGLDAAQARLVGRLGAALEAAGLVGAEHDEVAALDPGSLDLRLVELGEQLQRCVADAQGAASRAAAALVEAQGRAEEADGRADRMDRFAAAIRAHARHEDSRADYEQAELLLEAGERAEPVRPLLGLCEDADDSVAAALASITPDGEPSWYDGEGGEDLADSAVKLAAESAALRHAAERESSGAALRAELLAARAALSDAEGEVESLAGRERQLPGLLAVAAANAREARAAAIAFDAAEKHRELLSTRVAAATELARLEPERARAVVQRDADFAAYEHAVTEHVRLVETRLANMAAELAGALVTGEPCSVCGSAEHPAPARVVPGAVSASDMATAERARRGAERAREGSAQRLADLDERRAALAATAALGPCDDLSTLRDDLTAADATVTECAVLVAGLAALDQAHADLEVEAAQLANAQRKAAAGDAAGRARVATAEIAVTDLDHAVADASAGFPTVAARRRALDGEVATLSATAAAVSELRFALARRDSVRARAEEEAAATGFADLESARSAVLPRATLDELREATSDWERIESQRLGAVEIEEFDGLSSEDVDIAHDLARQARAAHAAADADARSCALDADRALRTADRFAAAHDQVRVARSERDEIAAQAAPVVHLAKLARGVAGHRRVNLTTYVLRQWFEQVVAAANVRLTGMSSGRYELVRVDEGASKTERAGLTLQVLDRHTGEQRSARSLSGGETFYTSLALALGLADVVRAEAGGVDLDTLFIDEGFGSLDADTLDQVMAVIDELRDRGRTVGIVSHVHELKDRIAERIEVRRLPDGSSTLQVVA